MAEQLQLIYEMNIGYVVTSFPTLSESFVLNEVLELMKRGINVHVLSLSEPERNESNGDVLNSELFQNRVYTFKGSLRMKGLSLLRSDVYVRAKYFINLIRRGGPAARLNPRTICCRSILCGVENSRSINPSPFNYSPR